MTEKYETISEIASIIGKRRMIAQIRSATSLPAKHFQGKQGTKKIGIIAMTTGTIGIKMKATVK